MIFKKRSPIDDALLHFVRIIRSNRNMPPFTIEQLVLLATYELAKVMQTAPGQQILTDIVSLCHKIHDFIHHDKQDSAAPTSPASK